MATLQGAIAELQEAIGNIPGLNDTPPDPTEAITAFPFSMAYPLAGELSGNRASTEDKSLHDVGVAIGVPLNDYRLANRDVLPLYETIAAKLITHLNGKTSIHYSTWGSLTYDYGPFEWPSGQIMYGYTFTIGQLKIINEV